MIPIDLQTVIDCLNIPFAAVACGKKGELQVFGDRKVTGNFDLVSTLFGNLDKVDINYSSGRLRD